MLHFSDEPYRFFAPKPNPLLMQVAGLMNRWRVLPRQWRIARLELSCPDAVRVARRKGHRLLFVPNHPSHADPQTMFEVHRRLGFRSMFMAAYDVFHSSRRRAWLLSRMGVFSVDRESSDKQSLNQAIQTLVEGRYALTIFPEGNVYLQNDLVTPFHEGAFYIARKALLQLQKSGVEHDILICPVSLKFTHMTDCRPRLRRMLHQVASSANTDFDEGRSHIDELRRIGAECLRKTMRQRGIGLLDDGGQALPQLIYASADSFLRSLERKIGLRPATDDSLFERIRAIRREVHRVRIDPERAADHEVAAAWANEAMTALRVCSYSGQYLDHPTLDRFAETTEKLMEDVYSRMGQAYAPRCAFVTLADPISLSAFLDDASGRSKTVLQQLTRVCENRVQAGIDAINAGNSHPGGQLY